jgi:hypothetical protein
MNDIDPRQIMGDRLAARRFASVGRDGDLGNFFGCCPNRFGFVEKPALIGRNRCRSLLRGTAEQLLLQPAVLLNEKRLVLNQDRFVLFKQMDARVQMINVGLGLLQLIRGLEHGSLYHTRARKESANVLVTQCFMRLHPPNVVTVQKPIQLLAR